VVQFQLMTFVQHFYDKYDQSGDDTVKFQIINLSHRRISSLKDSQSEGLWIQLEHLAWLRHVIALDLSFNNMSCWKDISRLLSILPGLQRLYLQYENKNPYYMCLSVIFLVTIPSNSKMLQT
jgi:hypothetical protein